MAGNHHREIAAFQVSQAIRATELALHTVGDKLNDLVAHVPPEGIIDHGQTLDIERHHKHFRVLTRMLGQQARDPLTEQGSLRQPRQRVEVR